MPKRNFLDPTLRPLGICDEGYDTDTILYTSTTPRSTISPAKTELRVLKCEISEQSAFIVLEIIGMLQVSFPPFASPISPADEPPRYQVIHALLSNGSTAPTHCRLSIAAGWGFSKSHLMIPLLPSEVESASGCKLHVRVLGSPGTTGEQSLDRSND